MNLKKLASISLATLMSVSMLASCSQKGVMEKAFVEEEKVISTYSSEVEGSALTIYVDINATEGGDGSESAPFKTIPEAQAKIRELKAGEGLPTGGITVLVKDGEYKLTESLKFTAEDSGTEDCPITYVSENEFGVMLTGGLRLSASDFEPLNNEERELLLDEAAKSNIVKVDLKKYGLTEADWGLLYARGYASHASFYDNGVGPSESEIYINGERQVLSRYPNDDFVRTYRLIETGVSNEYYTDTSFEGRGRVTKATEGWSDRNVQGGIFTITDELYERISKWNSLDNVWVFGYFKWAWADVAVPVKKIDLQEKTVELAQAVAFGISSNAPFYFYNVFAEMDTAGEYYIDRENGILYLYKTEDFDSAEIIMSCSLDYIVNISNASYMTLKGFGMCATRAWGMAITGHDVTVDNCKIYNVRGGAVNVIGTNITIQNNDFSNLGSYGVYISGGDSEKLVSSGNLVYNNYIHDFSMVDRTYTPAVAVYGCGTVVSHNELCGSPHEAVTWSGPNHIFEYNEVYNVCYETSDCGAFYAGRNYTSYGCVIRYNYIHDIGSGTSLAHAIYWDDGLSGQSAYGNLIVNTSSFGFLIGGGRDHIVENNLIIDTLSSPISFDQRSRNEMLGGRDIAMTAGLISTKNEYWINEFPIYGQIIPWTAEYEGDIDEPLMSANPSNCVVRNNISYTSSDYALGVTVGNLRHDIARDVPKFATLENNPIFTNDHSDIPGHHNEDYSFIEGAKALELCPDFKPLPVDEMGRVG